MIVKKRHYLETFLDIVVPAFLFGVLVALRFGVAELGPEDKDAKIFQNIDLFNNIKGKDDKQDRQCFSTEGYTANDYRQTTDKLMFKHIISTLR